MTERTPEEWGRVAVGLPGWRWMHGMEDTRGGRVVVVTIQCDDESLGIDGREAGDDGTYPDPDDPATAGCLLELLGAEAWRLMFIRWPGDSHRDGEWAWQTSGTPPATLGRACCAAAEALGRWPGGEQ